MGYRLVLFFTSFLYLLAACGDDASAASCTTDSECAPGSTCVDGSCVGAVDGGRADAQSTDAAEPDGGSDAGCALACGTDCCEETERCSAVTSECVTDLGPCADDGECLDDSYCDEGRCTPYGTLPRGDANTMCRRDVQPGRFSPAVQCRWSGPAAGDPLPASIQVESTAAVVDFGIGRGPDEPIRPSIVFISVSGFVYGTGGTVRIIDGRTCVDQGVLGDPEDEVGGATSPAVGDLDGDGVPEIVAKSAAGGIVAFEYDAASESFRRRWFSTRASGERDLIGGGGSIPSLSIADLNDDGLPEILTGGIVYGHDGVLLDDSQGLHPVAGYGQPAVVADVDLDGAAELITGNAVFNWDRDANVWTARTWPAGQPDGYVSIGDFGDFPEASGDAAGGPEIAVVSAGSLRIQTIDGVVVFGPIALPGGTHGGNPTVADFDGDGRPEVATGGPGSLTVFDMDCAEGGGTGTCASERTDGILWTRPVRDFSSGINGSSVFDFEGDGRAEVVYADECFLRVFDGVTGDVVWSAPRSSGTWIEAPIVADADGDFNAEIVVGSNSAHGACPAVDALHAGLTCMDNADCASDSCDAGYCRCTEDTQCGDVESYACTAPLADTEGTGQVCRARFTNSIVGMRVYADASDRWVSSRRVWNQHAYSVTNVNEDGTIPRTSEVQPNWSVPELNDFRRNVQGDLVPLAGPDLTIGRGSFGVGCMPSAPVIPLEAEVCNRGAEPVDSGMVATFFDGDPREGGTVICRATTVRTLLPGTCEPIACDWDPAPTEGERTVFLFVDEADDNVECVETNNIAEIANVGCSLI